MQSCGIIVEYNPFHNGHKYHAEQARRLSQADVVIAVMSGNFLQRGEPAIMDKWARTEAALKNGVDLVVELPFSWSVQSADYFAQGGVKLLQAMNCDALCFGTDGDDSFDYQAYGKYFIEHQEHIDMLFQRLPVGMSYPEKMAEVVRQVFPKAQEFPPNHILGLSYAKENAKYVRPMKLFPLQRKDQGYHDPRLVEQQFASATAIRQGLIRGENIEQYVPSATAENLWKPITWDSFWPYLTYQLTVASVEELQTIYQMNEGIEHRIKSAKKTTFSAFLDLVKSKRYTKTRLQRLLIYSLLQVKQKEIQAEQSTTMLHILGFTKSGQQFLNLHKKKFRLPIAAKIGQYEQQQHFLTYRADQVYQLVHPKEQNLGRFPIQG
ncbi:UPF0348 protein [Enterococcus florum]|uniref:tRNA(Met) cytidine acetate ligase n=1 Tax=Enterococcus florum TaxID=2480627 RepID=A0A4P5P3K5_9ENTE|nr:nucleotidyltransferase [Enterococcus florum]GCF92317.1 UPF0348 protein [Enterococcus florum]